MSLTPSQLRLVSSLTKDQLRVLAGVHVEFGTGCWIWFRSRTMAGYGMMYIGSRLDGTRSSVYAHRLSYQSFIGAIGTGLLVCHHCDTPSCCNPEHLFLGTAQENAADCVRKGRSARGDRKPHTKLSFDDVFHIRTLHEGGRVSQRLLAEEFSVTQSHISRIVNRQVWQHI